MSVTNQISNAPPHALDINGWIQIHDGDYMLYASPDSTLNASSPGQFTVKVIRTIEGNRPETMARCRPMLIELQEQPIPEHPNVARMWIRNITMKGHDVPAITVLFHDAGNILDVIRRVPSMDKLSLVKDAARGLAHLHSRGICHGNVHPNNILIAEDGRARISDMRMKALERSIHPDVSPRPSTWFYMSPEVLGREVCGIAGDVYAFACIVYVVYDPHGPFKLNPDVYFGGLQHMVERRILQKPNEMSQGLWELLQKCWKFDPLERPTMQQILCWMA